MLKAYLSSIVIWMIIIYCLLAILEATLRKNGWVSSDVERKNGTSLLKILFILSAVPIVRLIIVCGLIYMATITKEEYEKVKAKQDKEE